MTTAGLPIIAGWQLHEADYAEPVAPGGGWIEIQDNGDVEVAVELTHEEADLLGGDEFRRTTVPAAVFRELLKRFDAKGAVK